MIDITTRVSTEPDRWREVYEPVSAALLGSFLCPAARDHSVFMVSDHRNEPCNFVGAVRIIEAELDVLAEVDRARAASRLRASETSTASTPPRPSRPCARSCPSRPRDTG